MMCEVINFINLTPHAINIMNSDGEIVEIKSEGTPARVSVSSSEPVFVGKFSTVTPIYGEVVGVPEPVEGTFYIVSTIVAERLRHRTDILVPDSGPTCVRENGQIKYVKGFLKL